MTFSKNYQVMFAIIFYNVRTATHYPLSIASWIFLAIEVGLLVWKLKPKSKRIQSKMPTY